MLVTESASFSIVDSSGSPIRETEWTIRPPIADLTVEHGEVTVRALREGRAMLTGSTEYGAATATISIIPGSRFSAGTVRWTLEPTPDHESLITVQSVPSASGLVF
jgi:hypothetical protein